MSIIVRLKGPNKDGIHDKHLGDFFLSAAEPERR
jgi:hypothetical protein